MLNIDEINNNGIDLESSFNELDYEYDAFKPKLLVFGVGGGGVNAVNSMFNSDDLSGVSFAVANTDYQTLTMSPVSEKILLGSKTMGGLGAGSDPLVGKNAAEEDIERIENVLKGVNMLFLTAGMGGGTGTGATPVIAKKAKEMGILVTAIVSKPFSNEGPNKTNVANDGIKELKKYVDTLIIVPNQNLIRIANQKTTLQESLKMVDNVLKYGVKGITDLITKPGFINLDFADVRTVMSKVGRSMMGTGEASGPDKAQRAVEEAMSNPLLDNVSIKGAKGIIINVTGSPDITLFEYDNATKKIKEEVDNEYANMIIGNVFDETLDDTIRVSIFATGIEDPEDIGSYDENVNNNYTNNDLDEDKEDDIDFNDNNNEDDIEEKTYEINNLNTINNYNQEEKKFGFTKKIYTRKKIGEIIQEDENDVEDDFFDIGEVDKYDEFSKNIKTKNFTQNNENTSITGEEVNNFYNGSVNNNKINNLDNKKKQGFFSSLFSANKEDSKTTKQNSFDNDDLDVNIEYYNTPAFLRKKNK